ncbi:MAG: hypothetical protein ABI614_20375 [Planctomycetota bacterium]
MTTTTKIALAVELAERHMLDNGFRSGPCLGARTIGPSSAEIWEVEFAYEGLLERSPTTDPASIMLAVNLKDEEVTTEELM